MWECEWCGEPTTEDDAEYDADDFPYHYWCMEVACQNGLLDCEARSEYGECEHREP